MAKHPVLDMPLSSVLKSEIALPLQHVLKIYTVGCFLSAWRDPRNHHGIAQIFDSPEQAQHAAQVCAAFVGVYSSNIPKGVERWWVN